ncbi:MAG: UDP-N-acetylmuramoyl-L-alanyl-D-glutamate--2,6-diaminopimelate ligase [Desulfosarcinaceae bacterium]|nr:UDP-N-acetylmuramoyl-L-alanyl-D-glutamate--2,6-diaminopimelate ligase [Desulfosarcinaceae bacterium]
MTKLSTLTAALAPIRIEMPTGETPAAAAAVAITGLHYDSRAVKSGGLFVAIRGMATDGHRFIKNAIDRGAAAVVAETPVAAPVPVIQVADSRRALAELADAFYGHPSKMVTVIAVTGTNGKTTVTYLIESILMAAGVATGVIGTVNYRYAGRVFDNPVTTPESLDLQRILAEMRDAGITHVVMEASSHALDLQRVHCCRIRVGAYTNITQDHLDYHADMTAYQAAKALLFDRYLPPSGADQIQAVINVDDSFGRELHTRLPHGRLSCSARPDLQPKADIQAAITRADAEGFRGRLITPAGPIALASPLVGAYNLENILCAAGTAVALGIDGAAIAEGIRRTRRVPGRLEAVPNNSGRQVYVDYAHTPDALDNVLRAVRPLTEGRLWCVFGCGGDRDATKRPLMGEIAARRSDVVLVTSDNPRSEDPSAIIAQIIPGVTKTLDQRLAAAELDGEASPTGYLVEVDRRRAIELAIRGAHPGEAVLIAGKGHETYQIVGDAILDFDDSAEALRVLQKLEAS